MKLGEKIYKLRNLHKMSQEDLAQRLNVSRQSISKWENNTSVPELEKLIQLSEVFQLTLDELVKGKSIPGETVHSLSDIACAEEIDIEKKEEKKEEKIEEKAEEAETIKGQGIEEIPRGQNYMQKEYETQFQRNTNASMSTQRIIGFILLTVGLLSLILAFVFRRGLAILGGYLILCGILCLLVKKHVGLVIGWTTFILAMLLMTPFTGVRMLFIFMPSYWGTMGHIVGVVMWIILALLVFFTYRAIRKKSVDKSFPTYNKAACF